MTHRRRILLLTFVAVAAVAAAGAWLFWPRTAITAANAARLTVGMTRAEVTAILGGPARQEFQGVFAPDFETSGREARRAAVTKAAGLGAEGWFTERFAIWVAFDDEARVTAVASCPARQRNEESFVEMIRRRLHF
jgi:hypothetical protein